LVFTLLLSKIIPLAGLNLVLEVNGSSLVKVGLVSLVIAALSAFLPIRQITRLDPTMVFRGK
jgi:ABC-type antimicrobial peptide transport system permease subunit